MSNLIDILPDSLTCLISRRTQQPSEQLIDGWMNEWIDGWREGRTDRRREGHVCVFVCVGG